MRIRFPLALLLLGLFLAWMGAASGSDEASWWDVRYSYRQRLTLTNNVTEAVPSGYSVSFTLDHFALVTGGKSLASGNDVRVVFWDGTTNTEIDRVNETVWNTNGTDAEIWFPTQQSIAASGTDDGYYVYYGNATATAPPADRSDVYLWFDDFSTNTLDNYVLGRPVDMHGEDTAAMVYDGTNEQVDFDTGDNYCGGLRIDSLDVDDVLVECKMMVDNTYPTNGTMVMLARWTSRTTNFYAHFSNGNYQSPGIGRGDGAERNYLVAGAAPNTHFPADGSTHTMRYSIFNDEHRFWYDDGPPNAALLSGTDNTYTSGKVAIMAAQQRGWFDDFLVRRYVNPEPSTATATEGALADYKVTGLHPFTTGAAAGEQDVIMLRLAIATGAADTLTSLTVTSGNTSDGDVVGVSCYYTGTSEVFEKTAPFGTAGQTFGGGTVTFNGSRALPAYATVYLYVVYDVSAAATNGNTLDLSVAAGGVTISAATYPNAVAINPAGSRTVQGAQTLGAIAVTNSDVTDVRPGETDEPVLRIAIPVSGAGSPLTLNQLRITSKNLADSDVDGVTCYCTGTSATFATDTTFGVTGQPFGGGTVTFNGALELDAVNSTHYLFIAYDLSATATLGNTIDARLANGNITIEGVARNPASGDPAGSRTIAVPSGAVAALPPVDLFEDTNPTHEPGIVDPFGNTDGGDADAYIDNLEGDDGSYGGLRMDNPDGPFDTTEWVDFTYDLSSYGVIGSDLNSLTFRAELYLVGNNGGTSPNGDPADFDALTEARIQLYNSATGLWENFGDEFIQGAASGWGASAEANWWNQTTDSNPENPLSRTKSGGFDDGHVDGSGNLKIRVKVRGTLANNDESSMVFDYAWIDFNYGAQFEQITYRWADEDEAALESENVPVTAAPSQDLHLRVGVRKNFVDEGTHYLGIQYDSTPAFSSPTLLTASSADLRYWDDADRSEGAAIAARVLSSATADGVYHEDITPAGQTKTKNLVYEEDFAIRPVNTGTYYLRVVKLTAAGAFDSVLDAYQPAIELAVATPADVQACYDWAPDAASPTWQGDDTALQYTVGSTYLLAIRMDHTGTDSDYDWQLQYQSDPYGTPGPWVNVTTGSPDWRLVASLAKSNQDTVDVDTEAACAAGFGTSQDGVFSNDDDGGQLNLTANPGYTEFWYALEPQGSATGGSYRFRVTNLSLTDGFSYTVYPEAVQITQEQVSYRWLDNTEAALESEDGAAGVSVGSLLHLRVGVRSNNANWSSHNFALQFDTDSGFSSPTLLTAATSPLRHWDDSSHSDGASLSGAKFLSGSPQGGIYHEDNDQPAAQTKSADVLYEEDFTVEILTAGTYYLRLVEVDAAGANPVLLDTYPGTPITVNAADPSVYQAAFNWAEDASTPTFLGDNDELAFGAGRQYLLAVQVENRSGSGPADWWDASYTRRQAIRVVNNLGSTLPAGYSVRLSLDHYQLVQDSQSLASGDDVRLVYWNGSSNVELDRINRTVWNTNGTNAEVWFMLQANISASAESQGAYYVYFDNASAGAPPTDIGGVYDITVDWSTDGVISGFGGQDADAANFQVLDSGRRLRLWGNNWKATNKSVTLNSDYRLMFDFRSTGAEGEIHGLGFDTQIANVNAHQNQLYKYLGTQTWGLEGIITYTGAGAWQSFDLLLDEFTGSMTYMTFVNDADGGQNTDVEWRNVALRRYLTPEPSTFLGTAETYTWQLEFQRTDGTPGPWTPVATGSAEWKAVNGTYGFDGDDVTAAEFACNSGDPTTANLGAVTGKYSETGSFSHTLEASSYTEFWYVVEPTADASGKSYQFRLTNGGSATGLSYEVYPLAADGTKEQASYRWLDEDELALENENTTHICAPGTQLHLRAGIQSNNGPFGGHYLALQVDTDIAFSSPTLVTTSSTDVRMWNDTDRTEGDAVAIAALAGTPTMGIYHEDSLPPAQDKVADTLYEEDFTLEVVNAGTYYLRVVEVDDTGAFLRLLDTYTNTIEVTAASPSLSQAGYDTADNSGTPTWTGDDTVLEFTETDDYIIAVRIENTGAAVTYDWRLEYQRTSGTPGAWETVSASAFEWRPVDGGFGSDGDAVATGSFVTAAGAGTAVAGEYSEDGVVSGFTLGASQNTEFWFAVEPQSTAAGNAYRFRVTNGGATGGFSFDVYPEARQVRHEQVGYRWADEDESAVANENARYDGAVDQPLHLRVSLRSANADWTGHNLALQVDDNALFSSPALVTAASADVQTWDDTEHADGDAMAGAFVLTGTTSGGLYHEDEDQPAAQDKTADLLYEEDFTVIVKTAGSWFLRVVEVDAGGGSPQVLDVYTNTVEVSAAVPSITQEAYAWAPDASSPSWQATDTPLEFDTGDTYLLAFQVVNGDGGGTADYWDSNYRERAKITVENPAGSPLPSGYSVSVTLSHASLVSSGKSLASGNDMRIVYWDGSTNTEIDRFSTTGWNTTGTQIWFATQAAIPASGSDEGYYIYYDYSGAGAPPANPKNVFAVYVDFTTDGVISSFGGQDAQPANVQVLDSGATLRMWGNNWKSSNTNITINNDHRLEFDFRSTGVEGEINGVGLDTQNSNVAGQQNRHYQVLGTQSWGRTDGGSYTAGSAWQGFSVMLDDYTGNQTYVVFSNDADGGQATEVYYRHVRLRQYQSPEPTTRFGVPTTFNWRLQVQETSGGTPGPWTDVTTTASGWRAVNGIYGNDGDAVATSSFSINSGQGDGIPQDGEYGEAGIFNYTLDGLSYTELWYAVEPQAATAGKAYRFRLTNAGSESGFTYAEYAEAVQTEIEQVAYRWADEDDSAIGNEDASVSIATNTKLHLRVGVRANNGNLGNHRLALQFDTTDTFPAPTLMTVATSDLRMWNDSDHNEGDALGGGYLLAASTDDGVYHEDNLSDSQTRTADTVYEEDFTVEALTPGTYYVRVVLADSGGAFDDTLDIYGSTVTLIVSDPSTTQAATNWAPDAGAPAFLGVDTSLDFTTGTTYLVALRAENTGLATSSFDWQLQVQRTSGTPGGWADVTTSSTAWRAVNGVYGADDDAVATGSFVTGAGVGTAAAGQYSEDGVISGFSLDAGDYTEFWFAVQPQAAAAGEAYQFRLTNSGSTSGFTYTVYAVAAQTVHEQVSFRFADADESALANENQAYDAGVNQDLHLRVGVRSNNAGWTGHNLAIQYDTDAAFTSGDGFNPVLLTTVTSELAHWNDGDHIDGAAMTGTKILSGSPQNGLYHEDEDQPAAQDKTANTLYEEDFTLRPLQVGTYYLRVVEVDGGGGSPAALDEYTEAIQINVSVPSINQSVSNWAPDAGTPTFLGDDTAANFVVDDPYLLAIQVENTGGGPSAFDWQLQYQEDPAGTPGPWTNITTTSSLWRAVNGAYGNDGDAVATGDFECNGGASVTGGLTAEDGVYCETGACTDTLGASGYTEYWFAIKPLAAAAGKSYRFRLTDGGATGAFTYGVYPEAAQSSREQVAYRWADAAETALANENTSASVALNQDLHLRVALRSLNSDWNGHNLALEYDTDINFTSPTLVTTASSNVRTWDDTDHADGAAMSGAKILSGSPQDGIYHEDNDQPATQDKAAGTLYEEDFTVRVTTSGVYYLRVVEVDVSGSNPEQLDTYSQVISIAASPTALTLSSYDWADDAASPDFTGGDDEPFYYSPGSTYILALQVENTGGTVTAFQWQVQYQKDPQGTPGPWTTVTTGSADWRMVNAVAKNDQDTVVIPGEAAVAAGTGSAEDGVYAEANDVGATGGLAGNGYTEFWFAIRPQAAAADAEYRFRITNSGSTAGFTYDLFAEAANLRRWTGASSSAWSLAGNWFPPAVPGNNEVVRIPNAAAYTNAPNLTVATADLALFEVDAGGTMTVGSGGTLSTGGDSAVRGSLAVNAGGTLELAGGVTLTVETNGTLQTSGLGWGGGQFASITSPGAGQNFSLELRGHTDLDYVDIQYLADEGLQLSASSGKTAVADNVRVRDVQANGTYVLINGSAWDNNVFDGWGFGDGGGSENAVRIDRVANVAVGFDNYETGAGTWISGHAVDLDSEDGGGVGQVYWSATAVLVTEACAAAHPEGTLLSWETGTEEGHAGFLVYRYAFDQQPEELPRLRARRPGPGWACITPTLLRGSLGSASRRRYAYLDKGIPAARPSLYRLVAVDIGGNEKTVGAPMAVGLVRDPAAALAQPSGAVAPTGAGVALLPGVSRLTAAKGARARAAARGGPAVAGLDPAVQDGGFEPVVLLLLSAGGVLVLVVCFRGSRRRHLRTVVLSMASLALLLAVPADTLWEEVPLTAAKPAPGCAGQGGDVSDLAAPVQPGAGASAQADAAVEGARLPLAPHRSARQRVAGQVAKGGYFELAYNQAHSGLSAHDRGSQRRSRRAFEALLQEDAREAPPAAPAFPEGAVGVAAVEEAMPAGAAGMAGPAAESVSSALRGHGAARGETGRANSYGPLAFSGVAGPTPAPGVSADAAAPAQAPELADPAAGPALSGGDTGAGGAEHAGGRTPVLVLDLNSDAAGGGSAPGDEVEKTFAGDAASSDPVADASGPKSGTTTAVGGGLGGSVPAFSGGAAASPDADETDAAPDSTGERHEADDDGSGDGGANESNDRVADGPGTEWASPTESAAETVVQTGPVAGVDYSTTVTARVQTRGEGLVKLDSETLSNLGFDLSKSFTLTRRGAVVPLSAVPRPGVSGDPEAYVGEADSPALGGWDLCFYAERFKSLYSDTNVYWLRQGTGPGPRLGTSPAVLSLDAGPVAYQATAVLEADQFYQGDLASSAATEDHFFLTGEYHYPWSGTEFVFPSAAFYPVGHLDFTLDCPDALPRAGRLRTVIRSYSPTSPSTRVQVKVNGTLVADATWDGARRYTIDTVVPAGVLVSGANVVSMHSMGVAAAVTDANFVDRIELSYERPFKADGERLTFTAPTGGTVSVYNLSGSELVAVDVTSGVQMLDFAVGPVEEGFVADLCVVEGHTVAVSTVSGLGTPAAIAVVADPETRAAPSCEYLVIAHAGLQEAAEAFAAFHAGEGLSTAVLTLSEALDLGDAGFYGPDGIAGAIEKSGAQYVLLLGEMTYDYWAIHSNDVELSLPSAFMVTQLRHSVSDFVYTLGGTVAVGRIPARTNQEAYTVLAKVTARSASPAAAQTLVAAADGGQLFVDSCDAAQAAVSGATAEAYVTDLGVSGARTALLDAWNAGSDIIYFSGHGHRSFWAQGQIFTKDDVAGLSAQAASPLVIQLNCESSSAHLPQDGGHASLAELLLFAEGRGARAVIGSTNRTAPESQTTLGVGVLESLADSQNRIGDAYRDSLTNLIKRGGDRKVAESFLLLGDPAGR